MRLWTILYGTRPEAVKIAPILREFRRRGHAFRLICSNQHTTLLDQTATLDPAFAEAEQIRMPSEGWPPAYALRLASHLTQRGDIERVIVQGDTSTAYAGSLLHVPLYHVEAGVRTHQPDPWPEEDFRREIDEGARYGACATAGNLANLGHRPGFPVTGNTGIDQLYHTVQPTRDRTDTVLITLHRRESHGPYLDALVRALRVVVQSNPGLSFVWPVHPNPVARAASASPLLADLPNLYLYPPLDPIAFTGRLATAHAVITDSGGVQEEAAALGIPALIARPHTDRPESIDTGSALLLGFEAPDLPYLFPHVERLSREPNPCFGDGHAAPRIVDHLETL